MCVCVCVWWLRVMCVAYVVDIWLCAQIQLLSICVSAFDTNL